MEAIDDDYDDDDDDDDDDDELGHLKGDSKDGGGLLAPDGSVVEIREQDRYLPVANIARIMKKVLPGNAKIAKDAKESFQECVSEFISFITSEASDKCRQEKRKTINGDDLLWAMQTLGFEKYVEPLKIYLGKYRESVKGDKPEKPPSSKKEKIINPSSIGNGTDSGPHTTKMSKAQQLALQQQQQQLQQQQQQYANSQQYATSSAMMGYPQQYMGGGSVQYTYGNTNSNINSNSSIINSSSYAQSPMYLQQQQQYSMPQQYMQQSLLPSTLASSSMDPLTMVDQSQAQAGLNVTYSTNI